ncbi:uncharacterized protein UDID_17950 [Ustilago sp. UG-2017a]|nr:uncharacterized protein UDID_17950 [Ustilago sp. UG-2017a]
MRGEQLDRLMAEQGRIPKKFPGFGRVWLSSSLARPRLFAFPDALRGGKAPSSTSTKERKRAKKAAAAAAAATAATAGLGYTIIHHPHRPILSSGSAPFPFPRILPSSSPTVPSHSFDQINVQALLPSASPCTLAFHFGSNADNASALILPGNISFSCIAPYLALSARASNRFAEQRHSHVFLPIPLAIHFPLAA